MSETPTEPASPRSLANARARGDVPFARDWVFAAALFGCVWSWVHLGPAWADAWQRFAHSAWSNAGASIASVGASAFELLWRASLWMLAPCVLSWLVIGAQRVGALRLWGAQPKASQPPAHAGASQFATTLLAYARCAVLASVLVWQLRTSLPGLRAAWQLDVSALLPALGRVLEAMLLRAASGLLLLGGVDWTVQGWLRLRRLRMTRRQVLDEQRELVGDPRLMAERSARARNAAALGGEAQLTAAALLVTSERRVIALEYVSGRDLAPSVLLKAEAASAFKLLSQAYALALPLATDAWLTDELYALPVQQAIPEHLHARVATHLAAVQPVRIGSAL